MHEAILMKYKSVYIASPLRTQSDQTYCIIRITFIIEPDSVQTSFFHSGRHINFTAALAAFKEKRQKNTLYFTTFVLKHPKKNFNEDLINMYNRKVFTEETLRMEDTRARRTGNSESWH